jgi:hypothetical protein
MLHSDEEVLIGVLRLYQLGKQVADVQKENMDSFEIQARSFGIDPDGLIDSLEGIKEAMLDSDPNKETGYITQDQIRSIMCYVFYLGILVGRDQSNFRK